MNLELECMYCGKKWTFYARTKSEVERVKCDKCGDTSIKVRDITASKVDYYQGCPPFAEDKKEWGFF